MTVLGRICIKGVKRNVYNSRYIYTSVLYCLIFEYTLDQFSKLTYHIIYLLHIRFIHISHCSLFGILYIILPIGLNYHIGNSVNPNRII